MTVTISDTISGDETTALIQKDLGTDGYRFTCGPVTAAVKIASPVGRRHFSGLYRHYPAAAPHEITDFYLNACPTSFLRRWIQRDVFPYTGSEGAPFAPLPENLTQVAVEMGLNWQTISTVHQYLIFHAGVVERNGIGVIMPGMSGSGKSTLSAGLGYSGWRMLSDEFGLLNPATGLLHSYPRPISLKNNSADIMREYAPEDRFSLAYEGTPKGTITYLAPPKASIEAMARTVRPRLVLFPVFKPGTTPQVEKISSIEAFVLFKHSTVNNERLRLMAYETVSGLVESCQAYRLHYGSMKDGMELVTSLVDNL